jgi:hypothetical protein
MFSLKYGATAMSVRSRAVAQTKRSSPTLLVPLKSFFLSFALMTLLFLTMSAAFDKWFYWVAATLRHFSKL